MLMRKASGREFQTVGAENEKDLLPKLDLMLGIINKCLSDDLRLHLLRLLLYYMQRKILRRSKKTSTTLLAMYIT